MTKNLDGIKKITLKNFNKSNKIFSDVSSERKIFTKVDARNIIKLDNTKIRKVDGITERKMFSKHKEEQFKKLQKAKEAEYRYQEERIRLEKEEKLKEEKEEKLKEEKEAERRYQEEKLQKAKEERIRLEKKRQEKLLKKALKQKRRIALIKKIRICSKKALKNSLILLLFFAIFYIIFCVIVLKFSADNSLTRKINKHLFVPALIFDMGLINYYDYKDELIKNEQLRKDIVEKKLLKKILYKNLVKKYYLPLINNNLSDLEKKVIADEEINQSGLARIRKIDNLLKQGKSFEEVKKYSDDFGSKLYIESDLAKEKFGKLINDLPFEQVSDILIIDSGYYIIKKYTQANGLIYIAYIFIKAKTLDDYINNQLNNLKFINLAD